MVGARRHLFEAGAYGTAAHATAEEKAALMKALPAQQMAGRTILPSLAPPYRTRLTSAIGNEPAPYSRTPILGSGLLPTDHMSRDACHVTMAGVRGDSIVVHPVDLDHLVDGRRIPAKPSTAIGVRVFAPDS